MATPTEHNYVAKIQRLRQAGVLPMPVGVHQLGISHDDWCGIFQGQRCNCDPDITLDWSLPAAGKN